MAAKMPLMVDGLIRGDRVQPGTEFPLGLELIALQINLQEGLLENVFGQLGIAEIIPQIPVQLLLIPVDQLFERRPVSVVTILQEQLFVAHDRRDRAILQPRRILFNYAVHFCYASNCESVRAEGENSSLGSGITAVETLFQSYYIRFCRIEQQKSLLPLKAGFRPGASDVRGKKQTSCPNIILPRPDSYLNRCL